MKNVLIFSSAGSKNPTSAKGRNPFSLSFGINLRGREGLGAGLLTAIRTGKILIQPTGGALAEGAIDVRSTHALEIKFDVQERAKLILMRNNLESLRMKTEGLTTLITKGVYESLTLIGQEADFLCARVVR